jgi:ATP-binding cassette subfamily F protein 2
MFSFVHTDPNKRNGCAVCLNFHILLVYKVCNGFVAMPSDAKKKRDQKKKEAAKARQQPGNKKPAQQKQNGDTGGDTNGEDLESQLISAEGVYCWQPCCCYHFWHNSVRSCTFRLSLQTSLNASITQSSDTADLYSLCIHNNLIAEELCKKLEQDAKLNAEARACTGSLAVHPRSRDVKICNFSITFHGCEMLQDTMLELNCGRRYGLLGQNGSGMYVTSHLNDFFCNVIWGCCRQEYNTRSAG